MENWENGSFEDKNYEDKNYQEQENKLYANNWSISSLKEKGKEAFKRNYWCCVVAALILALVTAGGGGGRSDRDDIEEGVQWIAQSSAESGLSYTGNESAVEMFLKDAGHFFFATTAGVIVLTVFTAILIAVFLVSVLVLRPLEVGGCSFFLENSLNPKAGLGNLGRGFTKGCYGNVVVAMFVRDTMIFLFSLLLIIPGIIKAYEYRMVAYLLAENPELTYKEVLDKSKKMMDGQKLDAFLLDLSFIGWELLSAITGGIVGFFWTNPYKYAVDAELYCTLRNGTSYGTY